MSFGFGFSSGGGGTARYKTSAALMAERTVIADFENDYFYWNGAVRELSDWPATAQGRQITGVDWLPDTEWTIILEHETDTSSQTEACILSLHRGDGGNRLVEAYEDTTDANRFFIISASSDYELPDVVDADQRGRRRTIITARKGEVPGIMQENSNFAAAREVMSRIDATSVAINYRGWDTNSVWPGEVYNFSVIPRRLSSAEMRAVIASQRVRTPLFVLGDSFLNGPTMVRDIKVQFDYYRKIAVRAMGGTTLEQQLAALRTLPQYYDSTLVIMDGGRELDGPGCKAAILGMTRLLNHNRWLYIEPTIPGDHVVGSELRDAFDATNAYLKAAFPENFVTSYDEFKAAADGSAQDLDDIDPANDVSPSSLRSDTYHPSATNNLAGYNGFKVYADLILAALDARGW